MPLEQNAQAIGQYLPSGLVRPGLSTISVKLRFEIRDLAEEGGFVVERHGAQFRGHQHMRRVLPTGVGKRFGALQRLYRNRDCQQRRDESAL